MCWHNYKYVGWVTAYYWLFGVVGGQAAETEVRAKECTKCGKLKEV